VHCRLLRSKQLRIEADQWSTIKPIDMSSLIAASAQVDHLKANEAQSQLNNLISVDTLNDVSMLAVAHASSPQQTAQSADTRLSVHNGGGAASASNRSRSNQNQRPDRPVEI